MGPRLSVNMKHITTLNQKVLLSPFSINCYPIKQGIVPSPKAYNYCNYNL